MLARTIRPTRTLRRTLATLSTAVEQHDIVCVGGGPVGLALAAALGQFSLSCLVETQTDASMGTAANPAISSTHKITLIEGSNLDKVANWQLQPDLYSNRVSSITSDNAAFLASQFSPSFSIRRR